MKANLWTQLFAVVITAGAFVACGVEETSLHTANAPEDDGFQAETGDTGTDAGKVEPDATEQDSGSTEETDAGTTEQDSGSTEETDAGTTEQAPDAGETAPPANVDVARSSASCSLELSTLYIGGAVSGQIRGNIPGIATWDSGPTVSDADADGYLDFAPAALPVGSFDFSFVSSDGNWALYGAAEQLLSMTAAARSFVSCNWFDGNAEVAVPNPECHLRIAVAADCTVTGAGNMANLQ